MNKKYSLIHVCQEFEQYGDIVVSSIYKSTHSKLEVLCTNGHYYFTTRSNRIKGIGCKECYNNSRKFSIELIKQKFLENGDLLKSGVYKNAHTNLVAECKVGHLFKVTWSNYSSGTRCAVCSKECRGFENHIFQTLKITYPKLEQNVKGLLFSKGLELDIWFPNLRAAIECDGPWHYDLMGRNEEEFKEQIARDCRKESECQAAGIRLLRVSYLDTNRGKDYSNIWGLIDEFTKQQNG